MSQLSLRGAGDSGPGLWNKSAQFTLANSEYLSKADNVSLPSGNTDFTSCCWVYFDTVATNEHIIGQWGNGGVAWVVGYTFGTNRFNLSISNDGVSGQASATSNTFGGAVAGTWYFVVASHDGVNDLIKIQVNNTAANSAAFATGMFDSTGALTLGCSFGGGVAGSFLNGRMRSAVLWTRILTALELTWLYNSGKARAYASIGGSDDGALLATNLVSWWELGELSGARADRKNTNNLTDNNTVTSAAGPPGSEANKP